MRDIYPKIVEMFEANRFSVLATIINRSGSAPRNIGTRFLILEDGSSVGTIGGGLLEKSTLEEAEKVFAARLPRRFSYLSGEVDTSDPDMQCGTDTELFLEPVSPANLNHLYIFKEIMDIIRRGGSGLMATVVDADYWHAGSIPKMFFKSDGERVGSILGIQEIEDAIMGNMDRLLDEKQPAMIVCGDQEGNRLDVFIEPVISDPVLYIFGGGHVSTQVVPLAHRVGFKVVVIDDRPEFSVPANFPEAEDVYNYLFDSVMERFPINESSYILIMTRGHAHDKNVLSQALKTPAAYIGMIGSRRKISIIYGKLLEEGFTQGQLDQVNSPVGIDIGAETPEEIAISVIAELIKNRAGA
ncbi:XdhC family protein [Deltaproteobacteria bacterium]|nr:XdhC family protein [Deltaproteobacteria bacterium]